MPAKPNKLHEFSNYNFTIVLSAYEDIDELTIDENTNIDLTSNKVIVIAATGGTYNFKNSILSRLDLDRRVKSDYFVDNLVITTPINMFATPGIESIIPANGAMAVKGELTIKEINGFSFLNVTKQAYNIANPPPEDSFEVKNPDAASIIGGANGINSNYLLSIVFNKNISEEYSQGQSDIAKVIHNKVSINGGDMRITETGTEYKLEIYYFSASKLVNTDFSQLPNNVNITGQSVRELIDDYLKSINASIKDNQSTSVYKIEPNPDDDLAKEFFQSSIIDFTDNDARKRQYDETKSIYDLTLNPSAAPANSKPYKSSAVGAHQIVQQSRRGIQSKSGVTDKDLYNKETQDKLAKALYDANFVSDWYIIPKGDIKPEDTDQKKYIPHYLRWYFSPENRDTYFRLKPKNGEKIGEKIDFDQSVNLEKVTLDGKNFESDTNYSVNQIIKRLESGSKEGNYNAVLNSDTSCKPNCRRGEEVLSDWWKLIKKAEPKILTQMTVAEVDEFQTYLRTKGDPKNQGNPAASADTRRELFKKIQELKYSTSKKMSINVETNINNLLFFLLINSEFFLTKFADSDNLDLNSVPILTYFLTTFVDVKKNGNSQEITYYVNVIKTPSMFFHYDSTIENQMKERRKFFEDRTIKEYNYLFTGKNIDILNFDLSFNNIAGYISPLLVDNSDSSNTAGGGTNIERNDSNSTTALAEVSMKLTTYARDAAFENSPLGFYRKILFPYTGSTLSNLEIEIVGDYDFIPKVYLSTYNALYTSYIKLNIGEESFRSNIPNAGILNYDGRMFSAHYQLFNATSIFESNGQFKNRIKATIVVDTELK